MRPAMEDRAGASMRHGPAPSQPGVRRYSAPPRVMGGRFFPSALNFPSSEPPGGESTARDDVPGTITERTQVLALGIPC